MNYPAVDALIDTMNRQRSVDQFQTRFNLPYQTQLNLAGISSAEPRIPGSSQALDAAIQSMYLPSGFQGTQRFSGLGIPSLSMGTMGASNISQYPLGQTLSACAPGITCAPGCSPLEWNQTLGNVPYGTSGWNQNIRNMPCGTFGLNQARGNVFANQNLGNVPYGTSGWNQNLINQNASFAPLGSQYGSSQTGVFGRQFANQPFSQGFSPYQYGILSGATDCPLRTTSGQLAYQQPTAQSEKILHGLLLDKLEGLRATNWVEDALDLLKGQRSTDHIWNLLASGVAVDPMIVAQAIKVDRTVDFKVAEVIQNICNYRRRNSEAVHLSEHLMSGKVYDGPIFNSVKEQSKIAAMNVAKNQLVDLHALYGRI